MQIDTGNIFGLHSSLANGGDQAAEVVAFRRNFIELDTRTPLFEL